ncbi:MAG: RraA family protein [Comamonadaceae bacterium]|nr:MAG: RraA family protein [Comamonadaceae bacterium]
MNTQIFDALTSTLLADVGAPAMHGRIKPLAPGMRVRGRALAVSVPPGDNLAIHAALSVAQPGDVLVVDGGGYVERALMGGIMTTQAHALGLAGVVIDGAMRDVQELVALGLPVFAAGLHPAGPFKNGDGTVNAPIVCAGVAVCSGDWIVGDDDGVVVVPPAQQDALLAAGRSKLAREQARIAAIARGELTPGWLAQTLANAQVRVLPRP